MQTVNQINNFNRKNIWEKKRNRQQKLAEYMLPQHIFSQFFEQNAQKKPITDHFENATLLFADIAGFTEYSSSVSAEQVVHMLRNLFTEFDMQCFEKNAYKLYTIGDCYVIMGVFDANNREPAKEAKNVVEIGFEMIKIIEDVRKKINFEGLNMRIGIHTVKRAEDVFGQGNIIGGVLGTELVRYDIYGPDVMIANKMESNGLKGFIQVSQETKELLQEAYPEEYVYQYHKEIEFSSINRKTFGYLIDKIESLDEDENSPIKKYEQNQS